MAITASRLNLGTGSKSIDFKIGVILASGVVFDRDEVDGGVAIFVGDCV